MQVSVGMLCTPSQVRAGVLRDYEEALAAAGARVQPILLDPLADERIENYVDALLIPGGRPVDPHQYGETPRDDLGKLTPECDANARRVIERAMQLGMPMLGICKGLHMMGVVAGGSLVQDIASEMRRPPQLRIDHLHGGRHLVNLEPSILMELLGTTQENVISSHRQTLKTVPAMFAVIARSPDGAVEGIARKDCPSQWAVGFHPERQRHEDPRWNGVFTRLVADGQAWRQRWYQV